MEVIGTRGIHLQGLHQMCLWKTEIIFFFKCRCFGWHVGLWWESLSWNDKGEGKISAPNPAQAVCPEHPHKSPWEAEGAEPLPLGLQQRCPAQPGSPAWHCHSHTPGKIPELPLQRGHSSNCDQLHPHGREQIKHKVSLSLSVKARFLAQFLWVFTLHLQDGAGCCWTALINYHVVSINVKQYLTTSVKSRERKNRKKIPLWLCCSR